eukprot:1392030-Prymnesium_polylepis.1
MGGKTRKLTLQLENQGATVVPRLCRLRGDVVEHCALAVGRLGAPQLVQNRELEAPSPTLPGCAIEVVAQCERVLENPSEGGGVAQLADGHHHPIR